MAQSGITPLPIRLPYAPLDDWRIVTARDRQHLDRAYLRVASRRQGRTDGHDQKFAKRALAGSRVGPDHALNWSATTAGGLRKRPLLPELPVIRGFHIAECRA